MVGNVLARKAAAVNPEQSEPSDQPSATSTPASDGPDRNRALLGRAATAAYATLAVADAWLAGSEGTRAKRVRRFTKPLLMPTLALSALAQTGQPPATRRLALAGLGFGWLGDMALLRPGVPAFAAGAGCFGLGHLAYRSAFRTLPTAPVASTPVAKGLAGLWLASAPVLSIAAARQEKVLGPAVAGYSGLLCTMAAQAAAVTAPGPARRDLVAGSLLFVASDTLLGAFTFLPDSLGPGRPPHPPARAESLVMASYTAAQFLISRGLRRAAS